jgi:hypothetical protein
MLAGPAGGHGRHDFRRHVLPVFENDIGNVPEGLDDLARFLFGAGELLEPGLQAEARRRRSSSERRRLVVRISITVMPCSTLHPSAAGTIARPTKCPHGIVAGIYGSMEAWRG